LDSNAEATVYAAELKGVQIAIAIAGEDQLTVSVDRSDGYPSH
jgi:hypothetical protein